jgi:tRNA A-37 threonylcarbamoyl transferase component Bud32
VRFVFTPPAQEAAGLLDLPWTTPLAKWADPRLMVPRQTGVHRHEVRFVSEGGVVWVVKELPERLARREYRMLRRLTDLGIPAVTVLGVVVDRGPDIDAALVTRYLDYSTTYRTLFSEPRGLHPSGRLIDSLVELLVRLHLSGFYWGDCSPSNTLFRLDAGALAAYLVDAETSELHPSLSDGQRAADVQLASENLAGEILDLAASGHLVADLDPFEMADDLTSRYEALWDELTGDWLVPRGEERRRVEERVARLNDLGFDVDEIELVAGDGDGDEGHVRLRVTTRVSDPAHHRALLHQRTGLVAEENQARRLLNDLASFRAWVERAEGHPVPEVVAANRWLSEVYDPVVNGIPAGLAGKLDPVEVFHEVLEHRWFLSEQADRDIGTAEAAAAYFADVLPTLPDVLTSAPAFTTPPVDPPEGMSLMARVGPHAYDELAAAYVDAVARQAGIDPDGVPRGIVELLVEDGTERLVVRCGLTGSTFFLDWSGDEAALSHLVADAAGQAAYLLAS